MKDAEYRALVEAGPTVVMVAKADMLKLLDRLEQRRQESEDFVRTIATLGNLIRAVESGADVSKALDEASAWYDQLRKHLAYDAPLMRGEPPVALMISADEWRATLDRIAALEGRLEDSEKWSIFGRQAHTTLRAARIRLMTGDINDAGAHIERRLAKAPE